jgi:polar amino acid transport system permease protein
MSGFLEELVQFFSYYNSLFLLQAIALTVALTVGGCGTGYAIGFGLALLRVPMIVDVALLRWAVIAFVEFLRRIPFLILLFLVLFGSQALGLTLPIAVIAAAAIALRTSAIASENIRAGLQAVPRAQWDALAAMNVSRGAALRHVIVPQAARVFAGPSLVQFVQLLKATSLASQLGVVELTYAAKILNRKGFSAVICFGFIMIAYYVLCLSITRLAHAWGRRHAIP